MILYIRKIKAAERQKGFRYENKRSKVLLV